MAKIMFDSNAFDKMIETGKGLDFAGKTADEYEYYITPIQVEELAKIPDEKMDERISDFLLLCSMRAILIPIPAVVGVARVGYAKVVSEEESETLKDIGNGSMTHIKDDIIGTVAKQIGCTVITNDKKFIKKLNNCGIPTMTFEEWLDFY